MNLKLGLASLTLAVASLASIPAFAGTATYATPVAAPFAAPARAVALRGTIAAPYAAQIRAQMDRIDREARALVQRGRARVQALAALRQDRAQIEFVLARASRDGVIRPIESQRIDAMVDRMEHVADTYLGRRPGPRFSRR